MIQSQPTLLLDVQAFLFFLSCLAKLGYPPIEKQTPPAARASMLKSLPQVDLPEGEVAVLRQLSVPGPAGTIPALLIYARQQRDPGPVVIWFHGGGFVTGGIDPHRSFAAQMARQLDLPVVLVDYRLAPEAPYPAAPDDAEAAAR